MRIDANVSVRHSGDALARDARSRTELVAQSRARHRLEAARQVELLEGGATVRQETRHWTRTSARPRRCASRKRPTITATSASRSRRPRTGSGVAGPGSRRTEADARRAARRSHATTPRSGARIARRPRSGDRPRSRSVRHRGSRRRRSARSRPRSRANEIASDLEHVENLSIESYVATLNMEQSGALSATQAKTVLGEILANGESRR